MTWTYGNNPTDSQIDAVRFLVRDTDEAAAATMSDEEINWLLSENGSNVYKAAAEGAEELAAQFAGLVQTKTVGSLSITYAARAQSFKQTADNLRRRSVSRMAIQPFAGGISKAQKELLESDTDWNQPNFKLGMDDNPGSLIAPSTEF